MKNLMNKITIILEKINEKHIDQYTAQCAYFTILSFIPIVMLILTLTKYIGINQDTLFQIISNLFSSNLLNDAILGIVKEVYSKSLGTITISVIFVLWSAGNGFVALCKGLNAAYDSTEPKRFIYYRVKGILSTIIFIVVIILMLLLLVFGNSINTFLQEKLNIFSDVINLVLKSKLLISTIVLICIFTIMYRFIPKHKYKLLYQIPGAFLAAVACDVISIFYSLYVNIFTGFSIMYGSLTTVVLAMMWLYACMYSILLGAVINQMFCEKRSKNEDEKVKKY